MKEFLLILFFSKTVLLTPAPITFQGEKELVLQEPISAITNGAYIYIDVSKGLNGVGIKKSGLVSSQKILRSNFPQNSISATLYDDKGNKLVLSKIGYELLDDGAYIALSSEKRVPVDVDFTMIMVNSEVALEDVTIYWKNHKM